jgi:hypothetical protein
MVWTRFSSEGVKGSSGCCCCWVGWIKEEMTRKKKKRGLNLKIEAMASYEWIGGLFFSFLIKG